MKTIERLISEHPFFAGLDPQYVSLIAGCGKNVRFLPRQYLLKEGSPADSFYLIRTGEVSIESYAPGHGPLIIRKAEAESIVGFSWLFEPFRVIFDARALTEVSAVHLDGACLRQKAESDHELGYVLMKRFAHMMLHLLQVTRLQALDIYGAEAKGLV